MTPETILSICSDVLNIPEAEIKGKSRKAEVVIARHIYCYIATNKTNYTLQYIGFLINRDHSSVIHASKNIYGFLSLKDDIATINYNLVLDKIEQKSYRNIVVQDVNLLELSQNYTNSFV